MTSSSNIGPMVRNRIAPRPGTRKRAARPQRRQSSLRCPLRLEQLEDRVTPTAPAFATAPLALDGTATNTPHDWNQVYADAGKPQPPSGAGSFANGPTSAALAGSFEYDLINTTADTIFTGGGSKDTQGIQNGPWLYTTSKPQAKDDIENLFAAAYNDSNNHLILYAGMTRYDNSGDATAGFWFLQDPSFNTTTNSPKPSGSPFTGQHMNGDILLVTDFAIGGGTPSVSVFQWQGDDATGKLVSIGSSSTLAANTYAISNTSTITLPWSFTDKKNTGGTGSNQAAQGEFLEEGVDLTGLGLSGCFSTFEGETRSSTSPTATLSDFGFGSFPLCSVGSQGFTGISKPTDDVTYAITATNTGAATLYLKNVSDTSAQSWGGLGSNLVVNGGANPSPVSPVKSITVSGLGSGGSLAPGATVEVDVVRTVQNSDPDAMTDTTTFDFRPNPDFTGMSVSTSAMNTVNLFHPSYTLTVAANPPSATSFGTVITYKYTITNTSTSSSLPASGIPALLLDSTNQGPGDPNTFNDSLLGDIEADAVAAMPHHPSAGVGTLLPGESFFFTEQRAIQQGDGTFDPATGVTTLTDNVSAVFTLAQDFGNFSNQIPHSTPVTVTLLPQLSITKTVGVNGINDGTSEVIKPGDTASFTITVSNSGTGTATNVHVTDQLPDASQLTWTVTTNNGFDDTPSVDASGNLIGATRASLPGNTTISIIVSAVIPADIFGPAPGSETSNDPVPLDLFELDANAKTGDLTSGGGGPSTTASHDWDQVFADAGSPSVSTGFGDFMTPPGGPTSLAQSGSFAYDPVNGGDNIFAAGGSKDISGIQSGPWLSTTGKPQGKDDIENAFAALYKSPTTNSFGDHDEILYTGATRFDNSGDATMGFWFFQNAVSSTAGKSQPFTGTHTDGDILILADFSIGGSVSTPVVYRWMGDDATGKLSGPIATPAGVADAVVNGSSITLPWTFTNKSRVGGNTALQGEFLEIGLNLTALGLSSCFSSFLAETRSSTSTSATLSDFVVGAFPTCMATLPNTATVSADNAPSSTSNTATITVTPTGMPQLPSAPGSGAGTAVLTDQELQAAVTQAIGQWRAAGVDEQRLSALEQVPVHVADITWGWLGLTAQGQIWIDRTAAGWGWSTDSTPAAGRMDLLTVVTHEFGHILGLAPTQTGVMETTLAPGVRAVPEALSSTGVVVFAASSAGATASGATSFRALDLGVGQPGMPLSTLSRLEGSDAAFVTAVGNGGVVPATAGLLPDEAASQRSLAGVLLNIGPQTPGVLSATLVPASGSERSDRDSSNLLIPGLWPSGRRLESGGAAPGGSEEAEEVSSVRPAPLADPEGVDQVGVLLRQQASDACFADSSWLPDSATSSGQALAPAVAALGLLAGHWAAPRTETRRRKLGVS